ncbi:MAG: hypothetical protein Q9222_006549 [Ikaeria aurantiellina]
MAVFPSFVELVVTLLFSLCTVYIVQCTLLSPLKAFQGPIIAKLTNVWLFNVYYQGSQATVLRRLHDRYGSAVRVGPKHVSLSDPNLIKTLYSLRGDYTKVSQFPLQAFEYVFTKSLESARYSGADTISPNGHNTPTQFSIRDEEGHATMWRPIAKFYTMRNLLLFEPQLDQVIRTMVRRLGEEFCHGKKQGMQCNMFDWTTYAAWDVLAMTNFSRMQGFLEKGKDVDGSLADSEFSSLALACLGQLPWLERFLRSLSRKPIFLGARLFSQQLIRERRQLGPDYTPSPPDFLDNFFESQKANPKLIDDELLLIYLISNVAAGGDTTGATMAGAVYQILKHPHVHKRLQEELDANVKDTPVSYDVASNLTYFDAVMQEAIRIHPGTSFGMERVVPQEGLKLPDGRFVAPGMIVAMHGWIVNRDKAIFGPDADSFNPDRWLPAKNEEPNASSSRISLMKNTVLSFGGGKRRCIGKNFAILEIYKILATIFLTFDMALAPANEEPTVKHAMFVRMKGFHVILKLREKIM